MSDEIAAVAWLREQIEITKRAASPKILRDGGSWHIDNRHWEAGTGIIDAGGNPVAVAIGDYAAVHIARHDPLDVIADCEAKLEILRWHHILTSGDTDYEEFSIYRFASHPYDFGCVCCHYYAQGAVRNYGYCGTVKALASAYKHREGYAGHWGTDA